MRMRNMTRWAALASLTLCGWHVHAVADLTARHRLNIPSQPVTEALKQFAAQTNLQVVYYSEVAERAASRGAVGELVVGDALRQILSGTGLTFQFLNERTVAIRKVSAREVPSTKIGRGAEVSQVRLAQSDATRADSVSHASQSDSSADEAEATGDQTVEEVVPTARGIPEILVKGKRTLNADVKRTEDDIQPYVVFDSEQIQNSAAGNLEDFFRKRLPMNTVTSSWSQEPAGINGTQSQIDLRGLGTNQTLILVNGRRIPEVSNIVQNGRFTQPDINGIPMAAVERIEVLPSTASGIYGGGATGGVINIILKQGYAGIELQADYSGTFAGGGARQRYDATAGFSLEGGKTQVLLSASYSEQKDLTAGQRNFNRIAREKALALSPEMIYGDSYPVWGYTTNIKNAAAANLVLDNGTVLSSNVAHVPIGYAGPASDGGAAFVATAGNYNLGVPNSLSGSDAVLVSAPSTRSISANVRRQFGERFEAFLDLSQNENSGRGRFSFDRQIYLPADAASNPFTTDVRVSYPLTHRGPDNQSKTETLHALAGLIVRLPFEWMSELDYTWSRSRISFEWSDPRFNTQVFSNALLDGTLDVLRDLNAFPLDISSYILPVPHSQYGPSDTVLNDVTLRLAGPTLRLPAGPIAVSALIERREQEAKGAYRRSLYSSAARFGEPYSEFYLPRFQDVNSLYLEASVPIVAAANALPGVRQLDLQLSTRRDEYKTRSVPRNAVAHSDRPLREFQYHTNEIASRGDTLGLRYSPLEDVVLRASYGTGFLPPAIHQIAPSINPTSNQSRYSDPKRGNTSLGIVMLAQEGNTSLVPENSKSISAGIIVTPRLIPGLRLSLDYTEIDKTNDIGSLFTLELLQYEELFPGRIVRDELTAEDIALGYTAGRITAVYTGAINFAHTLVRALDIQADYAWRTNSFGDFSVFALATNHLNAIKQIALTVPEVDNAGFGYYGPITWRGAGGITWNKGGWSAGWNAQYIGRYQITEPNPAPESIDYALRTQGFVKTPAQIYHDAYAAYDFGARPALVADLLENLQVKLSIQNVFDKSPIVWASSATYYTYETSGDPRMRSYSISVRKSW